MNTIEAALNSHIVASLSDYGVIKAEGDDAQTFLHNQFTNDLKQGVSESNSQLSAYCSPKGRILALFRIFKQGDAYYMVMPKDTLEATLKRLRMFVLMSKVTLADVSDEIVCLGFSGPQSEEKLKALLDDVPAHVDGVCTHGDTTVIRVPGPLPRFEIISPLVEAEKLQDELSKGATTADNNVWQLLDIKSGIPAILAANIEAFVPQMINLQAINGLSFKKGCYPGQEIVARMQYLGKLKRRMYLLQCNNTKHIPQPGDTVFTPGDNGDHKAGVVVTAQASDNSVALLAVIEIAKAESAPLFLENTTDPELVIQELPYPLETGTP